MYNWLRVIKGQKMSDHHIQDGLAGTWVNRLTIDAFLCFGGIEKYIALFSFLFFLAVWKLHNIYFTFTNYK